MHEFEALLFSNPEILANQLNLNLAAIEGILRECGMPENINNSVDTAPSKRLEKISSQFKKTVTGISIAKATGVDQMRTACPLFGQWVLSLESLSAVS